MGAGLCFNTEHYYKLHKYLLGVLLEYCEGEKTSEEGLQSVAEVT